MRFLLLTQWPIEESTSDKALLKKTSEEGLDLVFDHSKEGATATVTYKVNINSNNRNNVEWLKPLGETCEIFPKYISIGNWYN